MYFKIKVIFPVWLAKGVGFCKKMVRLKKWWKNYDPTKRAWFERALAFPGYVTLAAPYLDDVIVFSVEIPNAKYKKVDVVAAKEKKQKNLVKYDVFEEVITKNRDQTDRRPSIKDS